MNYTVFRDFRFYYQLYAGIPIRYREKNVSIHTTHQPSLTLTNPVARTPGDRLTCPPLSSLCTPRAPFRNNQKSDHSARLSLCINTCSASYLPEPLSCGLACLFYCVSRRPVVDPPTHSTIVSRQTLRGMLVGRSSISSAMTASAPRRRCRCTRLSTGTPTFASCA